MKATLLHELNETDGAEKTFRKIIELINSAKKNIFIHMYVWRSDVIGNAIGKALCNAADRGVKIHIRKDLSAMMYEWIEMNQKSYLPSKPSKLTKLWWKTIRPTFPKTFVEDDFVVIRRIRNKNKNRLHEEYSSATAENMSREDMLQMLGSVSEYFATPVLKSKIY